MRNKLLCFALSAMLVLTFIPQISFAAEGEGTAAGGEAVTTEEHVVESTENTQSETNLTGVITGFVPLETTEYYYEGNPEENELTVNLPGTLSVYLDGSDSARDIPVTWETVEDFDHTDFYFYSMRPVWDSGLVLSNTLSPMFDVPWITVYKQEPENDSIEPVVTEEEIKPIYTEEEGSIDPEAAAPKDTSDMSLKAFTGALIDSITEDAYADTATNTAVIYNYLTRTMGLNTAAACGVMININAESAMSPINLQNTYNTKFGLSDTEYTSAVDKGKGVYKTSKGKKQNFKSDSGGYGLCQWTSTGRKTNLLNRAVSSKRSIGDINMQLEHLNAELQNYPQVLTTLRSVPNNATGAYIAAAEFCLAYEIPANTVATALARGKNCLTGYWQTYSGTAASVTGSSFISLCGYAYPTAMKVGKGMDVTGYAISNYNITSVTGSIKTSSGKVLYTKTLKPNAMAYKLSNLDADMKFAKLSAGTYIYTLSATDSLGKTAAASHTFTVAAGNTPAKALGFATTGSQASAPQSAATPSNTTTQKPAASVKKAYSGTFPKIPKRGYFKKGDKGTQVKNLQRFLNWWGNYKLKVDGKCGKKTIKTIKKFQKSVGLKADGKFGKKTLAKAKTLKK